jgi:DNA-binding MarR family transcriptional regulator
MRFRASTRTAAAMVAMTTIATVDGVTSPQSATPDTRPLDDRELRAWRGMLQVHAKVTRELDAQMHAEHGLSVSAYEVLMFLADTEAKRLRMAEIADRVLLSRSGLTRLVDRLVALGYVRRNACADDGRGSYAELTPAGEEKLAAARRTHLAGVRRFYLDRLRDDDQHALGSAWDRVLE